MNLERIHRLAPEMTPGMPIQVVEGTKGFYVIATLEGKTNIGIELGVAGGDFSSKIKHLGCFERFYRVNVYADIHDTADGQFTLPLNRSFT
jgi:hypothetical protein